MHYRLQEKISTIPLCWVRCNIHLGDNESESHNMRDVSHKPFHKVHNVSPKLFHKKLPRFSCYSTKYHVSLMPFRKKYYVSLMPVHKVPCFTHAIPSFIIATPQKYHECFKHAIPKKDHVLRIPHFTHFAFLQSAMFRSCHSTVLFFASAIPHKSRVWLMRFKAPRQPWYLVPRVATLSSNCNRPIEMNIIASVCKPLMSALMATSDF